MNIPTEIWAWYSSSIISGPEDFPFARNMLTHVKLVNASFLTTLVVVEGQTRLRKSVEAQRLYDLLFIYDGGGDVTIEQWINLC